MNDPTPLSNKQISLKWKTVATILIVLIGFIFGVGVAVTTTNIDVAHNTKEIEQMRPLVEQIPLIDYKLSTLADGQDEIKDLINKKRP